MSESQVQRRLVKSPPELWAELSDGEALARRLGHFGEIRITRIVPESTVVWEGDLARGTVELETAGWGTRVTLTATPLEVARDAPTFEPESEAIAEPEATFEPEPEPEPVFEPEPEPEPVFEPEPEPVMVLEPEPEPELEAVVEPEPILALDSQATVESAVQAPPRRGFFARMFGRSRPAEVDEFPGPAPVPPSPDPTPPPPAPDPTPPPPAPDPVPPAPDPEPRPADPPIIETPVEPDPLPPAAQVAPEPGTGPVTAAGLLAARAVPKPAGAPETVAAPALDTEEATAVLTAVLDDLGAAHHRPFSRG